MLKLQFNFSKQFLKLLLGFAAALVSTFAYSLDTTRAQSYTVSTQVYFSPLGGAAAAIIHELDQAKIEIRVQAYLFTNKDIAKALGNAKRRGIDVETILDVSNRTEKYSAADFILNKKIPTYIDAQHSVAHNKTMIIDREVIITGSFNFTKGAEEKNAENLLVVHSKELAATYLENWNEHRRHSEPYK